MQTPTHIKNTYFMRELLLFELQSRTSWLQSKEQQNYENFTTNETSVLCSSRTILDINSK